MLGDNKQVLQTQRSNIFQGRALIAAEELRQDQNVSVRERNDRKATHDFPKQWFLTFRPAHVLPRRTRHITDHLTQPGPEAKAGRSGLVVTVRPPAVDQAPALSDPTAPAGRCSAPEGCWRHLVLKRRTGSALTSGQRSQATGALGFPPPICLFKNFTACQFANIGKSLCLEIFKE